MKLNKTKIILPPDMEHWANNINTQPLPSWVEAFDYAYNLGLERGGEKLIKDIAEEVMEKHHDLLKKLEDTKVCKGEK